MQASPFLPPGYEQVAFVAKGGYGTVWHCRHLSQVAIKVIPDFKKENARPDVRLTHLKRIFREVVVLDHFKNCPEFVPLVDVYLSPDGKDLHLVMPLLQCSLFDVLASKEVQTTGGLGEDATRYIIAQVLSGLAKMESSRCIHRDITPGNILIGSDSEAYLADFGLSRAFFEDGQDITANNIVTRGYRPPEILLGSPRSDNKIDVWSAGVISMEMLLGVPFLQERDAVTTLKAIFTRVEKPMSVSDVEGLSPSAPNMKYIRDNWDIIASLDTEPLEAQLLRRNCAVSSHCLDVLRAMLRFDPMHRRTAREILQMPWFQEEIPGAEPGSGVECLIERLKLLSSVPPPGAMQIDVELANEEQMLAFISKRASCSMELSGARALSRYALKGVKQ